MMKTLFATLTVLLMTSSVYANEPPKPCYQVDPSTKVIRITDSQKAEALLERLGNSLKGFSAVMEIDGDIKLISGPTDATNGMALLSVTGVEPAGKIGDHWYNYYKFVVGLDAKTCKSNGKFLNIGEVVEKF